MTVLFYILVSLCLVLIKTTLIPELHLFEKFYDLLIPIIIYLSFFRRKLEGIPIVIFFGFIMDSLCGGPMGLYLAIYIWLYVGTRWIAQFLHTGSFILLTVAVALGVIFEIAALLGYMVFLSPNASIPVDAGGTIVLQIMWALLTGPLILIIISWAQKQIDVWRSKIFVDL
jgi:cell shape-determining protein MreD